jgi:formate dehydrogenase subunit delta
MPMSHDVIEDGELDHHAMVEMKLIRMANQIATYFDSRPEAERVSGIAAHINDFWEPRMRTQLLDLIARRSDAFKPEVVAGRTLIRKPSR